MGRVVLGLMLGVFAALLVHQPAMASLCGVKLGAFSSVAELPSHAPADEGSVFWFTLGAPAAKTAFGSFLVWTDTGRIRISFKDEAISKQWRPGKSWYTSSPLFVRLPAHTKLRVAYIESAGPTATTIQLCPLMNPILFDSDAYDQKASDEDRAEDDELRRLADDLLSKQPSYADAAMADSEPFPKPQCKRPFIAAHTIYAQVRNVPEMARQQGYSGDAWVIVELSPDSAVLSTQIYQSSGSPALDASAIRATREATFATTTFLCRPIHGSYLFIVSFQ